MARSRRHHRSGSYSDQDQQAQEGRREHKRFGLLHSRSRREGRCVKNLEVDIAWSNSSLLLRSVDDSHGRVHGHQLSGMEPRDLS